MSLSAEQNTALKNDINANTDAGIIQALLDGNMGVIATFYNTQASPDYYIFQSNITPEEMGVVIELDDLADMTTGDVQKLTAFFLVRPGGFNGENASDRAGFNDVFSTTAGDDSQQAVAALWQRLATYAEELFATGTGSLGSPATAGFTGFLTAAEINVALQS